MPRIRTVKPDFWDSPDTAQADLRTRLLYIAMWNWADDYGIGDAIPSRVIGFAFPNDDIPAADYPRILADVSDAFGAVFFEHLGRRYFVIPEWDKHQRTEKKAKPKDGLLEAAQDAIAAARGGESEPPPNASENPPLDEGSSVIGSRKLEREGEPSPRCPTHQNHDTPPPCMKCKSAREANEAWHRDDLARKRRENASAIQARRDCEHCDENGMAETPTGMTRCTQCQEVS